MSNKSGTNQPISNFFKVTDQSRESGVVTSLTGPVSTQESGVVTSSTVSKDNQLVDGLGKVVDDITPPGQNFDYNAQLKKLKTFKFPCNGEGKYNRRCFKHAWLEKFTWIEYSIHRDAAFCFICRKYSNWKNDQTFTVTGFNNWRTALSADKGFSKHAASVGHRHSLQCHSEFLTRTEKNASVSDHVLQECNVLSQWRQRTQSARNGKLGHGNRLTLDKPKLIETLKSKRIRDIACGSSHSAAITSSGELYTWGLGEYRRLGHGDNCTQLKPKLVTALLEYRVAQVTYHE